MTLMQRIYRTIRIFAKLAYYLRLSRHPRADYTMLKKRYVDEFMRALDLQVIQKNKVPPFAGSTLFVANHISYLDIPLLIKLLPTVAFVSKAEVAGWPVIGSAAKKIGTVFVKRESKESRADVRKSILQAWSQDQKQIVVFPSSTTSITKTERWRKGVFEIAQEAGVAVIPLRISYTPLRAMAYIDDDNLLFHLLNVFNLKSQAVIEWGEPCYITDPIKDCERIRQWCEADLSLSKPAHGLLLDQA